MKKALLITVLFTSLAIFSQNGYTIVIDGKEVFVKDNGTTIEKPATSAKSNSIAKYDEMSIKSGVHIVKKGENLYSISRLYNLTVEELCNINNINKEYRLELDQSLRVVDFTKAPVVSKSNATLHTVKKEDTLYNISKRYGLSVQELKSLNNLTSNLITINQRLRVN